MRTKIPGSFKFLWGMGVIQAHYILLLPDVSIAGNQNTVLLLAEISDTVLSKQLLETFEETECPVGTSAPLFSRTGAMS